MSKLFQPAVEMTPLEMLEREIGHHVGGLNSAIAMRKAHPTYGYTKASILERLARLEGLVYAWGTIRTGFASAAFNFAVAEYAEVLGIDIASLRQRAVAA